MTLPVLNDISKGICHKYHNFHIEMKNSKNTPLFPPLKAFSEKLKIILLYNRGLYGRYRSADKF